MDEQNSGRIAQLVTITTFDLGESKSYLPAMQSLKKAYMGSATHGKRLMNDLIHSWQQRSRHLEKAFEQKRGDEHEYIHTCVYKKQEKEERTSGITVMTSSEYIRKRDPHVPGTS